MRFHSTSTKAVSRCKFSLPPYTAHGIRYALGAAKSRDRNCVSFLGGMTLNAVIRRQLVCQDSGLLIFGMEETGSFILPSWPNLFCWPFYLAFITESFFLNLNYCYISLSQSELSLHLPPHYYTFINSNG